MVLRVLRSRKFAKRVLLALLVLIIPAFVLWGVGSMRQERNMVGTVAGRNITPLDMAESRDGVRIQLILARLHDMENLRRILNNRTVVNYMAWERLIFLHAAKRTRQRVTDEQVTEYITGHPLFQTNGQFNPEIYSSMIVQTFRVEPRQFEERLRENLLIQAFRSEILKDIEVSDEELSELFHLHHDRVELEYMVIPDERYRQEVTVTEEDGERFYRANPDLFASPERVALEYISVPFASGTERAAAVSHLDDLTRRLDNTDEFAEKSELMGFDVVRTELFPVTGTIPGMPFSYEVHQRMLALEEGDISRPIVTGEEQGVVYLLRKTRAVSPSIRPYEEVKETAREKLEERKMRDLAFVEARALAEKLREGEISFQQAAEDLSVPLNRTGEIGRDSFIEGIGPAEALHRNALKMGEENFTDPAAVRDGVLIAKTLSVIKADQGLFQERKEEMRRDLLFRKRVERMEYWFEHEAPRSELHITFEDI